jgi:hypothetical protein
MVVVHVGYDVTLAPGADAAGIAVDLVALDVTVAGARLTAELQDAGMNVAGVKVVAMDKDTKIEAGTAVQADETGVAAAVDAEEPCVNCETDPAVTAKIGNLTNTVKDQADMINDLRLAVEQVRAEAEKHRSNAVGEDDITGATGIVEALEAAGTGSGATGEEDDGMEGCLDGDCELLNPLKPAEQNVTAAVEDAESDLVDAVLSGNMSNLTALTDAAEDARHNETVMNVLAGAGKDECNGKAKAKVVESSENTECNIVTVTGVKCAEDLTFEQAGAVCASRGKRLCKHAEIEAAFQCGFRTTICGWTQSKSQGARLIERLLETEVEICELADAASETTYGAHCCEQSEIL